VDFVLGLLAQSRPRPVVKEYYREPACSRGRPRPREIGWKNPIERSLLSIGLKSATPPKEFGQRALSLVSQEFHSLPREWEKLFCLADPEFLGRDRFGENHSNRIPEGMTLMIWQGVAKGKNPMNRTLAPRLANHALCFRVCAMLVRLRNPHTKSNRSNIHRCARPAQSSPLSWKPR
jgi:hypothetical protein